MSKACGCGKAAAYLICEECSKSLHAGIAAKNDAVRACHALAAEVARLRAQLATAEKNQARKE